MAGEHSIGGSSDRVGRTHHRLTLHIPNSYPRATSPRHSPVGSPSATVAKVETTSVPEDTALEETILQTHGEAPTAIILERGEEEDQQRTIPPDEELLANNSGNKRWKDYFRTDITSGESSRDFLARERTYFSWLRLATFLAIASVALFLRLRLRIFSSVGGTTLQSNVTSTSTNDVTQHFIKALARKALRKQLLLSRQSVLQLEDASSSPPVRSQLILSPLPDDTNNSNDGVLDSEPAFSKVLGIIFFILALLALIVGHIDYMRCERALEKADKLVTLNEDDPDYDPMARLHSALSARQAHSNRMVHFVEIFIAMAIFAVALIILITVHQGNIAPVPSL